MIMTVSEEESNSIYSNEYIVDINGGNISQLIFDFGIYLRDLSKYDKKLDNRYWDIVKKIFFMQSDIFKKNIEYHEKLGKFLTYDISGYREWQFGMLESFSKSVNLDSLIPYLMVNYDLFEEEE